ncbi:lipocalin-like domain-containing protein [Thiohalocapsa sp. ML1]|uniref:lipocalin-like domain-containing protein n=1 Tax=Thiohalocapsa sp. ML1 TaxID=1431688 RepID=UPI000731EF03|nr:lipocalin-like domain-containing protein [Thiohalocapsa sp. ML1]
MRRLLPWLALALLALSAWWLWPSGGGVPRSALDPVAVAAALPALDAADGFAVLAPAGPDWLPLPEDLGPHPDQRTELWDLSGQLRDAAGEPVGFRLTLVRVGLRAAVERPATLAADAVLFGRFALVPKRAPPIQSERASRMAAGLAGAGAAPPAVWLEDWRLALPARGTDGRLRVAAGGVELDLTLRAVKDPIAPAAALLGAAPRAAGGEDDGPGFRWFAAPRLAASGQLLRGGQALPVSGTAWLDRAWGGVAALGAGGFGASRGQLALNRFLLQLDDGSELLCIQFRRRRGGGTPVPTCVAGAPDGGTRVLRRRELTLEPTAGAWRSPASGAVYPLNWRLAAPALGLDLTLAALTPAQELTLGEPVWSGAVTAQGERDGQAVRGGGRMELGGYAAPTGG